MMRVHFPEIAVSCASKLASTYFFEIRRSQTHFKALCVISYSIS